jgi:hypothetical protein
MMAEIEEKVKAVLGISKAADSNGQLEAVEE